ncbi:MAG: hypothetical protein HYY17_05755 [Planctomycetes bacterium]|nr:hypothetical protein [Planctomycetota bacterium]
MPRTQVTCTCGWVFFVSADNAGGSTKCPSCQKVLHVRSSTTRRTVRPRSSIAKLIPSIGLAAGVLVIAAVAVVFVTRGGKSGGDEKPKPESAPSARWADRDRIEEPTSRERRDASIPKKPVKDDDVPRDRQPDPIKEAVDYHRLIDLTVYQLNAAGLVSELFRHRGQKEKRRSMESKMETLLQQLQAALEQVAARGERHFLNEYFRLGDRAVHVEGSDLKDDFPEASAKVLASVLAGLTADTFTQCQVLRKGERVMLLMYWKWIPKEVRDILACADLDVAVVEERPEPAPVSAKLPADLLDRVRKKLAEVHPYYLLLLAREERERVQALLKSGEGSPDDASFLRGRVLVEFAAAVDAQLADLDARIERSREAALKVERKDLIHFKNGTRRECRIIEETAETLKVEVKIGAGSGTVTYRLEEIERIERGGGIGIEFPDRLAKAGNDVKSLETLLEWCDKSRLKDQAEHVALRVIRLDPAHAAARTHLGYARDSEGFWLREEDIQAKDGKFYYEGKWLTLVELERRLAAQGLVKGEDGLWYAKARWNYTLDNLYGDLAKVEISYQSGGILDQLEVKSESVFDTERRTWVKRDKTYVIGRFLGGYGMEPLTTSGRTEYRSRSGTVSLTIRAPGPIHSCRVMATAQVTQAGALITARAYSDAAERSVVLYSLASVGTANSYRDVTAAVRGRDFIVLEADVRSGWSANSNGHAMFLPCTRQTVGVLSVTGEILKPAENINRILTKGKK